LRDIVEFMRLNTPIPGSWAWNRGTLDLLFLTGAVSLTTWHLIIQRDCTPRVTSSPSTWRYFDLARVLITSTPLWLLNLRATARANHHKQIIMPNHVSTVHVRSTFGWSLIDHACIGLSRGLMPRRIHDLKSRYCFCAHIHEIRNIFC